MSAIPAREDVPIPGFSQFRYRCVDCERMFSRFHIVRLRFVGRFTSGGHYAQQYRCQHCHAAYWERQEQKAAGA